MNSSIESLRRGNWLLNLWNIPDAIEALVPVHKVYYSSWHVAYLIEHSIYEIL